LFGSATLQSRENRDSSAQGRSSILIPNALSSSGLRCSLEEVQSVEDVLEMVHRAHPDHGRVFFLEGNRVIEESKNLCPTQIRYVLQCDLEPALRMLETQGVSKASPTFLQSLLSVLRHQEGQDKKAVTRAEQSYRSSFSEEQVLRGKVKALSKEINGIGEVCDDIIMHDDFSWMKGHVMSRCLRNVISRLRVSISEVKVKRESLRRLERSYQWSSQLLARFKQASMQSPQIPFGPPDDAYMKENKDLNVDESMTDIKSKDQGFQSAQRCLMNCE